MYQGTGSTSTNECDNCGAQLPPPDEHGTRTCTFCKATYSAPAPAATAPPVVNLVINAPGGVTGSATPVYTPTEFTPINPKKARSGCGCLSWTILLIVVASIGVPLYFAAKSGDLSFSKLIRPSYNFGTSLAVLPGEPNQPANFVTTASHYDAKTVWEIMRFNGTDKSGPAWTQTVPNDTEPVVLADGNTVFVANDTTLLAYKSADGTKLWQATLSDGYSNWDNCGGCFATFPGTVTVKTKDGNIQAFDAATGTAAWKKELASPSDKIWRTSAHLVIVRDSDADKFAKVFDAIDPATGTVANTFDPACVDPARPTSVDHAGSSFSTASSVVHPDSMYVAFGSNPGCIQLWDAGTGAMAWNAYTPDTSYSFTSYFNLLERPDGYALITSGEHIGAIPPEGGTYTELLTTKDTQYWPAGFNGTIGILNAKNTRGTTKWSLVGVDLTTGGLTWTTTMDKASSVDVDHSSPSYSASYDGTYTANVHDGSVYIIEFFEGSSHNSTMQLVTADANTGTPSAPRQVDSNSNELIPDFGPGHWRGSQCIVRVGDTVQVIDVATGQKPFVYP